MHSETMEIQKFESSEAAKKAGFSIPLTEKEADFLMPMNRAARRQWAKDQRKKAKKTAQGGSLQTKG